jgi:penicillin-binding protein 1A
VILGKIVGTTFLVGVLAAALFLCIFAIYVRNYLMPQLDFSVESFSLNQTSVIYYEDPETGEYEVLQELYGTENRSWASLDEIPRDLYFAAVAIEDKRFFDHNGVDWLRTLRASVNMFLGGDSTYGASTITQQLIKNLTSDNEVTVRRKLTEIFRALEFEKNYSKQEILEWYLNTIYMGEQCYGVRSAAQVYFGKDVSELSLAECASLIGITNNPSIYDPYINPDKNKERQVDILYVMLEQGYIDRDAYEAAKDEELVFQRGTTITDNDNEENKSSTYYSYFVDQVIRDVVSDLSEKTGYDSDVVSQMVMSGGYSIYATIDVDVQEAVDEVYTDLTNLPATESTYQQLQSAIVIIDNTSGDIVALAGGVGEKTASLTFSRATQSLLSPGSTIKPLTVYAPALDLGYITPATVYDDTPYTFEGTPWPKNYDRTYHGLLSISEAVALSTNTIPVKLVAQMSPEYCYQYGVDNMGLTTLTAERVVGDTVYSDVNYAPLALGSLTNGVTVKAVTAAYAAFANNGTYREARTYTKVLDSSGNVILDNTQDSHTATKEMTAYYMTEMLENAVETGTGAAAQLDNMPVAGKTGTTTSDYDRWFAGYTPYYTAAVWCGYDEQEEIVMVDEDVNPAIEMWRQVMEKVHEDLPYKDFYQPSSVVTVTYCADSGLLATEWCEKDVRGSRVVTGKLSLYDVPTTYCDVHVEAELCPETEQLASDSCAKQTAEALISVGMLNVTRSFPVEGVVVLDQQYVAVSDPLTTGRYGAETGVDDPVNEECTVHGDGTARSDTTDDEDAEPEVLD